MSPTDLAIVVLIPVGASGEEHSTLLYFDVNIIQQMCPIVQAIAQTQAAGRIFATVVGETTFGGIDDSSLVQVALLGSGQLAAIHDLLSGFQSGQWGYSPHISKQPGVNLPLVGSWVTFDRIAIWNHDEKYAWRLGTGARCAV